MLTRGAGCIIDIASIDGLIAYPQASAYLVFEGWRGSVDPRTSP